jgi:hypothetical protein
MRPPQFNLRTLVIVAAIVALLLVATPLLLRMLDIHIHDTYFRLGPPP